MIQQFRLPLFTAEQPLVIAYGLGVDSTSILVELARRQMRPDLIMFANVGGPYFDRLGCEKEETYDYLGIMNDFLKKEGFPQVTVVSYVPKNFKNWPPYWSLEQNCLTNGTLPSLAFGFKSCSLKWKASPQDKFLKQWAPAQQCWAAGLRVKKVIGYDCGPKDIRRYNHAGNADDPKYEYWYPLIEWGWDRLRCQQEIAAAGLPVPPKSSCFFCPAMKPWEVDALPADKLKRLVLIEARAKPRLGVVQGLWRKATKTRPGSMTEYIRQRGLLPAKEIDRIIQETPTEIEAYQAAFQAGKQVNAFGVFVDACLNPQKAAA